MGENAYKSQQEAIILKAKERNIAFEELNAVFDQKFDSIVKTTLERVQLGDLDALSTCGFSDSTTGSSDPQYRVWEHYCEFDAPIAFSSFQGP
jgi:hypothetical protein